MNEVSMILCGTPMIVNKCGDPLDLNPSIDGYPSVSDCHSHSIRFSRLQALHRLLCGETRPEDVLAIDNGSAAYAQTAYTLASMGSTVIVKEPARPTIAERRKELAVLPAETRRLISHKVEFEEIDAPSPANIVYWSNPDSTMLSAFNYLARDVKPGGFLVIQTDIASLTFPTIATHAWRPVANWKISLIEPR